MRLVFDAEQPNLLGDIDIVKYSNELVEILACEHIIKREYTAKFFVFSIE